MYVHCYDYKYILHLYLIKIEKKPPLGDTWQQQ